MSATTREALRIGVWLPLCDVAEFPAAIVTGVAVGAVVGVMVGRALIGERP